MTKIIDIKTRRGTHQVDTTGVNGGQRIYPDGLYRWADLQDVMPISRETWRKRVNDGTAPKPIRIGTRCTSWRGSDVLEWLSDPVAYKQPPR